MSKIVAENNRRLDISDWFLTVDCSLEESNESDTVCPFPERYGLCDLDDDDDDVQIATEDSRFDRVLIPFDYEVYYTQVEDPPLHFLQGFLLHQLAQALNLPDCSLQTRMRRQLEEGTSSPSNVKAVLIDASSDVVVSQGKDDVDYSRLCTPAMAIRMQPFVSHSVSLHRTLPSTCGTGYPRSCHLSNDPKSSECLL